MAKYNPLKKCKEHNKRFCCCCSYGKNSFKDSRTVVDLVVEINKNNGYKLIKGFTMVERGE
jgi:hypothetical protein